MATLEHRHIVQVFSETVSQDDKLRLICMQYVPGITLATLMHRLRIHSIRPCGSEEIRLQDIVVDEFDASKLAGAESVPGKNLLNHPRFVQAVCQLMAHVADALAHAHLQGVFHRDIKPANILIDRGGEPLLADFSLSLQTTAAHVAGDDVFGGTLAYMSPEHLEAFAQEDSQRRDAVNQQSDIYSLGLVLYELLTLESPVVPQSAGSTPEQFAPSWRMSGDGIGRELGTKPPKCPRRSIGHWTIVSPLIQRTGFAMPVSWPRRFAAANFYRRRSMACRRTGSRVGSDPHRCPLPVCCVRRQISLRSLSALLMDFRRRD